MFNKKILVSLMVIGIAGAIAGGSTLAYFNDTEASTGNTFTAGAIDMMLGTSNGNADDTLYQGEEVRPFFTLEDVKPGDVDETTVAFNVSSNPSYACAAVLPTENADNGITEPEGAFPASDSSDGLWQGELAQNSELLIWAETDGDNVYEPGDGEEPVVINRTSEEFGGDGLPTGPVVWTIADSDLNIYSGSGALNPGQTYYLGVEYSLPWQVGNEVQTDSYSADVVFYTVQSRHNDDFSCSDWTPLG